MEQEQRWWVLHGDALETLRECPDNHFHSLCCDPPSGTGFMNRSWDNDKGGRDQWIAWLTGVMKEALRVLKPGAHALVWALPRTSHWTAMALEDAGWDIRTVIHHHFGSGFPKSQNVGKFIDKMAGAEREVVGKHPNPASQNCVLTMGRPEQSGSGWQDEPVLTAPATDEAKAWDGWGTALKPATEHWILARKPLSESSIAKNVLVHGTGALNIDACRVDRASDDVPGWHKTGNYGRTDGFFGTETFKIRDMPPEEVQARCGDKGRWPPDLLLSHSSGCQRTGTRRVKAAGSSVTGQEPSAKTKDVYSDFAEGRTPFEAHGNGDGTETVEAWECAADCPVGEIDRQSGVTRSGRSKQVQPGYQGESVIGFLRGVSSPDNQCADKGGVSRFFPTFRYQAKPSRAEREAGCEDLPTRILNRVNPGGLEEPELSAWYDCVLFVARSIRLGHLISLRTKVVSIVPESVISQVETILGKETPIGAEVDGLAQMVMSTYGTEGITHFLNTALYWNNILGALSKATSMFTTSTKSSLTIDLKTLNSCLQRSTPKDIFLERSESSESTSNATSAKEILNGWHAKYGVGTHSALRSASENIGVIRDRLRFAPVNVKNNHPTVKSISLMSWLIKLITPPEGLILDPFCGSGSTGAAAVKNGFRFVGIDQSEDYCNIARARLRYWEVKLQCDSLRQVDET